MKFKDHFSDQSPEYGQYRPEYPADLFTYLASICPQNKIAWDCATGTGQAAKGLSNYFSTVIATDASSAQVETAKNIKGINFSVVPAEKTTIDSQSVDLITVAQALHWFDIEDFFMEVNRVLNPKGVLAVWTYNLMHISNEIDEVIQYLYGSILEDYWPQERLLVEQGYSNITFPYKEVIPPSFEMKALWNLEQLLGYLDTWSATKRYKDENGSSELDKIYQQLSNLWTMKIKNGCEKLTISWPMTLIIRIKP